MNGDTNAPGAVQRETHIALIASLAMNLLDRAMGGIERIAGSQGLILLSTIKTLSIA